MTEMNCTLKKRWNTNWMESQNYSRLDVKTRKILFNFTCIIIAINFTRKIRITCFIKLELQQVLFFVAMRNKKKVDDALRGTQKNSIQVCTTHIPLPEQYFILHRFCFKNPIFVSPFLAGNCFCFFQMWCNISEAILSSIRVVCFLILKFECIGMFVTR